MPIPATWSPKLLALLRIVAGLGFLHHGTSKFFNLPPFPMPLNPLFTVAGVLELAGGALIVLGLLTRPVAFVLAGMSAVAYFMVHAPKSPFPSVNGGEPVMLYCFIFLYLAAAGAGAWSVDATRSRS
ncbi:DoxX family protein [Sphingomonas sp. Leaf357]|uniref:DoxX family protein n=1 Tax=Sphingomonas sp. Leaf357 TaxID=1736350 RepID=UPI000700A188|nr:DoxX family protein [Sphingomonas sp. Leaf357]KQS04814.1 DoxX family protein [Sphingomonas sp. Leaf357]